MMDGKAKRSDDQTSYLYLTINTDNNSKLNAELQESMMISTFILSTSYGIYISNVIRYARCCTYHEGFVYCHIILEDTFLTFFTRQTILTQSRASGSSLTGLTSHSGLQW